MKAATALFVALLTIFAISWSGAAQAVKAIQTLEPDKPVERELAGGQNHDYQILLAAGQYLYAVVEQRGVDVVVTLFGPDGKQLLEVDSPNGTQGPEPVLFIVELSGTYRFSVRSLEKDAAAGRYEAKIEELRAATGQDRERIAGQAAFAEAEQLRATGKAEAIKRAVEKYTEAATHFHGSNDAKKEADALNSAGLALGNIGEMQKALEYLNQALPLYRTAGDRQGEATTINSIGRAFYYSGEKQKALEHFNQVLLLYRSLNDARGEGTALNNIGLIYRTSGDNQMALKYYTEALPLARAEGNKAGLAVVLYGIGQIYHDLEENQKALEHYNEALPLMREVGDRRGETTTLNNIGGIYLDLGENQKGLKYYTEALPLVRAQGDKAGEATVLNNIGRVYYDLGEYQKPLGYFNQALPLYKAAGDRNGEATALNNIGEVNSGLGENQKALEYYNQALLIQREVGDRRGEATTLNNIGTVHLDLGENQKALEYFNRALPLCRAAGDKRGEDLALGSLGAAYAGLGEHEKALEYYSQALPLARTVGDKKGETRTLINLGAHYHDLGEVRKAQEYYEEALLLARELGNRRYEGTALNNLGATNHDLGETQTALDHYNAALPIARAAGDRKGEATTLNTLGAVYGDLGENQKALEYYNQALLLRKAVGDRRGEATTLNNIGAVFHDLKENQKALEYYSQALLLRRAVGDRGGEAAALNNIGAVHSGLGENQKALEYYSEVLPLVRTVGNRRGEAKTLDNIGQIYWSLGDSQKALQYCNEALLLARAVGDRGEEASTLLHLARIDRAAGNLTQAEARLEACLKILEWLRSNVTSPELRASYFATVQTYYRSYADLLMEIHRTRPAEGFNAMALEAGERGRARSLLEMLREGRADIRQGAEPALLGREKSLTQLLGDKSERLVRMLNEKPNEQQVAALKKEISEIETDLQQVEAAIRKSSPRYAALTQPEPLKLKEIQQGVLDGETILLEYALLKERSYLWVVGPESVDSFDLPKQEEIESAARLVYELLTARNRRVMNETAEQTRARISRADAEFAGAAGKLSRMVLGPAAKLIQGKRLLVVGDGALQYIPFEALPDPAASSSSYTPLIAAHEVVSVPSASVLAEMRRETAGRKAAAGAVAIFADPVFDANDPRLKTDQTQSGETGELTNLGMERSAREVGLAAEEFRLPRLPFTRQEAEQISLLAGKGPVMKALDLRASVATAISPEVSGYRMVHFATHGLLNAEHPSLSGIVLSLVDDKGKPQNGFLKLQDVYNLNLPAELVVLSACQTGLGKEIKGEGLVGLTRGFMYAGAKRIVASLWKVDDVATAELMKRFYGGMLVGKQRPAEALRAAQAAMQAQRRWSSPYYWAAFVLQGEWK
jgi:tetratricopeptide (TPR) repeat protein